MNVMRKVSRLRQCRSLLVALAAVWVLSATTSTAVDEPHVLVVTSADLPQFQRPIEAFIAAHQGPVTTIEVSDSKAVARKRLERAAGATSIDGVFAVGAKAAWLSANVLPDKPLVFAMVIDWQRYGLTRDASGVSVELPVDALLARFRLLLPSMKRLGIIYSPLASSATISAARAVSADLGIELKEETVVHVDDVAGAYRRIRSGIDALWMLPDPVVVTADNFRYLATRTRHDRVAFLAFSENFVRAGALLSVAPDYGTMGSQAAALLKDMLGRQQPQATVQAPIGSSLVINATTAGDLGIAIDGTMLSLADKIIQEGN